MRDNIIDGKKLSAELNLVLKNSLAQIKANRAPKLTIVQVGDNPSSNIYIRNKINTAKKADILVDHLKLEEAISQPELTNEIIKLNNDESVDGIIIQQPLPKHINTSDMNMVISPDKDADGFHPITLGNVMLNNSNVFPGTPHGIVKLLEAYNIPISGAKVTIIGRSNIVGKPLANMLINMSATVTSCNTKTKDLINACRNADILISAAGVANLITTEYVNPNMVIIDVGANFVDGKYCGDVDFENVQPIVKAITPVPGGVGPMTIHCLLDNTYNLFLKHIKTK